METRALGRYGEELAVSLLRSTGLSVLKRNYSLPAVGELDCVCNRGDCLISFEIKTRRRTEASGSDLEKSAYGLVQNQKAKRVLEHFAAQYAFDHYRFHHYLLYLELDHENQLCHYRLSARDGGEML